MENSRLFFFFLVVRTSWGNWVHCGLLWESHISGAQLSLLNLREANTLCCNPWLLQVCPCQYMKWTVHIECMLLKRRPYLCRWQLSVLTPHLYERYPWVVVIATASFPPLAHRSHKFSACACLGSEQSEAIVHLVMQRQQLVFSSLHPLYVQKEK